MLFSGTSVTSFRCPDVRNVSNLSPALIQELGLDPDVLKVGLLRLVTGGYLYTGPKGEPCCSGIGAATRKFGPMMWASVSPSAPRAPARTRGPYRNSCNQESS